MALQLSEREEVIRSARQHWIVLIPDVFFAIAGFALSLVVLAILPNAISGHDIRELKALALVLLVLGLPLTVAWSWLQWRFQIYVLTNRRLVKQVGVVTRTTVSIALERVVDSWMKQGVISHFINVGDVAVQSAGRDGVELLHMIPGPQDFFNEFLLQFEYRMYPMREPKKEPVAPPLPEFPTLGEKEGPAGYIGEHPPDGGH